MNECSTAIVEVMKSSSEMALGSGILRRCILGGRLPENFQESRSGSVLRYQKLCCPQNRSRTSKRFDGWLGLAKQKQDDHP
jgi:hypothetical protein